MAADWIKMRHDLRDDPAVVSIARKLKLDVDAVVGKLHAVWSWADRVTEDGMIDGVDAALVDDVARRKGFAAAMAATPRSAWLVIRSEAVEFPRFDRHNGKSAKRRALDVERKRNDRSESDERPPPVPQDSASDADIPRTESGPEKRREEKTRNNNHDGPTAPVGAAAGSAGDVVGEGPPRAKKPPDPVAVELCAWLGDCIAHWKPDARIQCESTSSLEEMRRLIQIDKRDPERVRALLGWLFGGTAADYAPSATFDWRPQVQSGGTLRRQWDRLDVLYAQALSGPQEAPRGR